jgi:hypothetical protein
MSWKEWLPQSTPTSRRLFSGFTTGASIVAAALGVVLVITLCVGLYKGSERNVTAVVESKERVCGGSNDGHSSCKYLVFTDHGTFKVTDTILYTRFDSSDVYGRIEAHKTYKFHVVGWRYGLFSMYPNVLRADAQ